MTQETRHFKIGLFVVAATVLTLGAILWLGASALFEKKVFVETYLDESVQGLEVGSPVKLRGVQIGSVESIEMALEVYGGQLADEAAIRYGRYVIVTIAVHWKVTVERSEESRRQRIALAAERGLRVRLASSGLTGIAYLEADYLDPETHPPLKVPWEPRYLYVPSAPSTMHEIVESLDEILGRLSRTEFEKAVADLDALLVRARQAIDEAGIAGLRSDAETLLADLRTTTTRLRDLLSDPKLDTVAADLSAIASGGRRTVERIEGETLERLNTLLGEEEAGRVVSELADVVAKMKVTVEDLTVGAGSVDRTLRRFDRFLAGQERHLDEILENLSVMTRSLRELSQDTRQNPARALFGDPPPPSKPENR